jgi:hypothetical protein
MSTSGTNTFITTEATIIQDALLLLNEFDPEEAIDAADYSTARRMLNMLTKFLATEANLWVTVDVAHTLTPGTASYTVGTGLDINTARPLRLDHARRTDGSSTQEIPIWVVSREDYMALPNKATESACLEVYYDPQLANGVLYCWPTGDTNNTDITLTFKRPLEDFVATGDNPDFPKEWALPLVTLLAERLAPQYLGQVPQWLKIEAVTMLATIKAWDEEDVSIFLQPGNHR